MRLVVVVDVRTLKMAGKPVKSGRLPELQEDLYDRVIFEAYNIARQNRPAVMTEKLDDMLTVSNDSD